MKRHGRILIAALALSLAPLSALAQPVFFDDFDGNALLPHWNQPPASHWEYNVSNSMLNVTGLFFPSHPKISINWARMSADFATQSDFQLDAWMGWEMGQPEHRLELVVSGGGVHVATVGYWSHEGFPEPMVFFGTGTDGVLLPAPPPGIHHFTINRTASQYSFYLDGSPMASFQNNFATPASHVNLEFRGPYPGTLGPFHIDRIVVVPAPATIALLPLALFSSRRRSP